MHIRTVTHSNPQLRDYVFPYRLGNNPSHRWHPPTTVIMQTDLTDDPFAVTCKLKRLTDSVSSSRTIKKL